MKKNLLKKLMISTILMLMLLLSYKVYLNFYESDFRENNYLNIKSIEVHEKKENYSFAVFGSAENSIDVFEKKIVERINEEEAVQFVISTGNAVKDGAEGKYRQLYKAIEKLNTPVLFCVGDNEISKEGDRLFYKHFGPFYYSFDFGNAFYIFIDTTGTTAFEIQKEWLANELNKAKDFKFKFIFMNDSPLKANEKSSIMKENIIEDEEIRQYMINEFSTYKVSAVFTNGSAYKARLSGGVPYYSSGGAGGLYLGKNSYYHYIKVNVTKNDFSVKQVAEPLISDNIIIQRIENIWIYIHSMFYAQYLNIIIAGLVLLLLFLFFYRKAEEEVNYYKNYEIEKPVIEENQKLIIAMFTNNYLPIIGGVPISISRLASALRSRGNIVIIFAPESPQEKDNEQDVFRCPLLFVKKAGGLKLGIANIFSPKIYAEFAKNEFDIVHVHHPFWMGKKGLNIAKKYRIPVILTYHTRFEVFAENLPFMKKTFRNIISHKMIKRFAQKCDAVTAPTISAKEYLSNIGVSRNKLILPTGVNIDEYRSTDRGLVNDIRSLYASEGELLLCCVSRLSSEKNLDFLVKGLKEVKDKTSKKFRCIIIGSGPEKETLQNCIDINGLKDDIYLIGTLQPQELPSYYIASDLFVFSSLSETQGMVLIEAMAGECPVVCIKSSGINDFVKNGVNGYKTSQNIQEWSERIVELLENSNQLHEMGKNAFEFSQKYSVEKIAERAERFYKTTIIDYNEHLKPGKEE